MTSVFGWLSCNVFTSLDIGAVADGADAANDASMDATVSDGRVDAALVDSAGDVVVDAAPPPACDVGKPFGSLALVAGLEGEEILSSRLTADGLTMYYAGVNGAFSELLLAYRTALDGGGFSPFSPAGEVPVVNTGTTTQYWPTVSTDGLFIFFESDRTLKPDDAGVYHDEISRIWTSTRAEVFPDDFGQPFIYSLFQIEAGTEAAPYFHQTSAIAGEVYFASDARGGAGNLDIFVAAIDLKDGYVQSVTNVADVNTNKEENMPLVSEDGLTLYFALPDVGNDDTARNIMRSTRASLAGSWSAPVAVTELNSTVDEFPSFITADSCTFYFISTRPTPTDPADAGPGQFHVWQATRPK